MLLRPAIPGREASTSRWNALCRPAPACDKADSSEAGEHEEVGSRFRHRADGPSSSAAVDQATANVKDVATQNGAVQIVRHQGVRAAVDQRAARVGTGELEAPVCGSG